MKLRTISRNAAIKIGLALCTTILVFSACSQQSMQGAGRGAASGAAVGAVGGMVTALVFGGNVGEAAARGAVYGGSTGAAAGAISGAVADSNQKKAQEAAQGYARTAAKSGNADFSLAGLWLQVITYADSRQEDQARALYPELVEKDNDLSTESQAETEMQAARKNLMDIRQEYKLPRECG